MSLPIEAIQSRVRAESIPIEQLAGNKNVSDVDKAKEVARQFESVLLRQILKSVHQPGIKGMFDEGGNKNDIYFDMMNYHLADSISRSGGLGLATSLEAQLIRQTPSTGKGKKSGDDQPHI